MATRSLTEAFILMRNNALQNKNLFSDHINDDHSALVTRDETDIELGNSVIQNGYLLPQWSDKIEEIRLGIGRISSKMKILNELHNKHLNRPTMDDSVVEEKEIEHLTNEITRMFQESNRSVQQFGGLCRVATGKEFLLGQNMTSTVARTLQELSTAFRTSQSSYLKKLQGREERHSQYFSPDSIFVDLEPDRSNDFRGFTTVQMHEIEDDSMMVEQREKEIMQIVRSIHDLNDIFKELSFMIVDQGTILDRIDFNIEASSHNIESGLVQLQKAEKYQKKNRKMHVILCLCVVIVLMLVILIAKSSIW